MAVTPLERLNKRELIEQLRSLQSLIGDRHVADRVRARCAEYMDEPQDAVSDSMEPKFPKALSRYARLYALAPVGLLSLDVRGCIQEINTTGAALLGWARAWLLGQPFSRWVVKDDLRLLSQHLDHVWTCNSKAIGEVRIKNRSGRPVDVRMESIVIGGSNREPVCQTGLIDISEARQTERKARLLQAELARMARLNTMGEIAASLAHELNQPLGTVKLYCDTCLRMLRQGTIDESRLIETLEHVSDAAQRGGDIIRHLRGFLRKDGEPRTSVDLNMLIEETVELVAADVRDKGSAINLELASALPHVCVDRIHIEQVLLNLVRNSIEAMHGAGTAIRKVTINTRQPSDNQLQVSVSDTGPGLSAEGYSRAFEPFYSTKPTGMGMGLAISRSMIESHTGRLWGEPGVKGGARFCFTLPVTTAGHPA